MSSHFLHPLRGCGSSSLKRSHRVIMAVEMAPKMVAGKTSRNKRRGTSQSALTAIYRGSEGGYMSPYTVFNTTDLWFYCVKHNLQRSTVDSIPSPSPPPVCVQATKTRGGKGKDQGTKLEVNCLKRKKELRLGGEAPW